MLAVPGDILQLQNSIEESKRSANGVRLETVTVILPQSLLENHESDSVIPNNASLPWGMRLNQILQHSPCLEPKQLVEQCNIEGIKLQRNRLVIPIKVYIEKFLRPTFDAITDHIDVIIARRPAIR